MPVPIQLKQYVVADLRLTPNSSFKSSDPIMIEDADFVVEVITLVNREKSNEWQLVLKMRHQYSEKSNYPYTYALELAGFFEIHSEYPPEKIGLLMSVTGASMLFGAAREVIRSISSLGPFGPVFIPSVAFSAGDSGGKVTIPQMAVSPPIETP